MLALLIPGRESVTSENIDVYLTPLIEELLELWKGVPAIDVSEEPSRQHFKLRLYFFGAFTIFPRTDSHQAKSQKDIERVRNVGLMLQLDAQRLSERMYI